MVTILGARLFGRRGQDATNPGPNPGAVSISLRVLVVFSVLAAIIYGLTYHSLRRLLPGFEVVGVGDRGKGARTLATAVTIVTLVIGPVLNGLL